MPGLLEGILSQDQVEHVLSTSSHMPQLLLSIEGDISGGNSAFETQYGYVLDKIIGLPLSVLLPDWTPGQFRSRVLHGPDNREFVSTVILSSGKWTQASLKFIGKKLDGQAFYVCILSGVNAEHELIKGITQLFHQIFEPYLLLDLQGRVIDVNLSVLNLLGYQRVDFIGRQISDITKSGMFQDYLHTLLEKGYGDWVTELYRFNGQTLTVHIQAQYVRDFRGEQIVCIIRSHQTKELMNATNWLQAEEHLSSLVNNLPVILWSIDEKGMFTLSEGQGLQVLGFLPGQVVGQSVFELYKDYPDLIASIKRVLSGDSFTENLWLGDNVFRTRFIPIKDLSGKILGANGVSIDVSENQRAEQKSRSVEARLAEAQKIAKIGSWELDLTNKHAYWSDQQYRLLGYEPGSLEASYQGFLDRVHPLDLELVKSKVKQLNSGETDQLCFEHRIITQNSINPRIIRQIVKVNRNELHVPIRIVGTSQDITEQKEIEQALQQSESYWQSLTINSPDYIFLVSTGARILFINRPFENCPIKDLKGHYAYEILPRTYMKSMAACFERVISTREPDRFDVEYLQESENKIFECYVSPIINNNQVTALTVSARDVTDRKKVDEHVSLLNEHIRLLLESTEEGIYGVDQSLRCTFINKAGLKMLGYELPELKNNDLFNIFHRYAADAQETVRDESVLFKTVLNGKSYFVDDTVMWHKDGYPVHVQFSSNPIVKHGMVLGAVVVFRNISERRDMAERLNYMATHDMLTSLLNRYEFERRLEEALDVVHALDQTHVLCYMDLDQFKVVNDTCGHVAGDELLSQLSVILRNSVDEHIVLARLGGDEFGILFPNYNLSRALERINVLKKAVREFRFVWENKTFVLGLSIGVVYITKETDSVASALSVADAACYVAKEKGRNRIHVYQEDDLTINRRHGEMHWVIRINEALESGRLLLDCQRISPVNGSEDGHFIEILLRLRDEKNNIVMPGAFIPAAERYNIMGHVDRWVVASVFKFFSKNKAQLDKLKLCAINLSGHSIGEERFLDYLIEQLKHYDIPNNKICFELTETSAISNLNDAVSFISELKAQGCYFALDDFGSGMSSFTYLKNLPVDFVKIDGNFVRDIVDDPIDEAMVKSIHNVGQVMGIKTIAEFVENRNVLSRLQAIGVDYVQGYAIATPHSLQDL